MKLFKIDFETQYKYLVYKTKPYSFYKVPNLFYTASKTKIGFMIHLIKISILLTSCLLLSNQLTGQSLIDLLADAKGNNLTLKILEKEYYAALEKAPQVSQLPDPEVGLSAFLLPVETRLGPQIFRVGATQMLPWKGILSTKKDLELAKAKAIYERIAVQELELTYQIKKAWLQLYEIQQSQLIIQRNLQLLESLDKLALAKVESGKTTGADVLMVQLKKEELLQELAILKRAEAKPLTTINQLLNRPLETEIVVRDSLSFAQIPYHKDSLMANIQGNHPMIRMYALQQEVAKKSLDLSQLDSKPDFGIGLDYIMTNRLANSNFENNGRDVFIPRVSVKIPIYKKKYGAKEREEQLKIEALETQKLDLVSQYLAKIDKAMTDYEMARLKVDLYHKQMTITQSAITILETDYSTRGNSFDELLQLEKELIAYDLKLLKAIVQSHQAKINIERYLVINE